MQQVVSPYQILHRWYALSLAHGSLRAARIEIAKLRNEEKENILETKTKDTEMFHKLVRIR
jgi:hypothetical protein